SPQAETLRYLNFVVDKLDLREHMQFSCRVESMVFDEDLDVWRLSLEDGRVLSTRVVISAMGPLSTPTLP
ncbi:MAG: cyclohexanone monooxygenase, partial [Gammaproteobacteria bacterium]|nr:cyclohexanone monooxygenase [Gammaproteobacteria bacterium]